MEFTSVYDPISPSPKIMDYIPGFLTVSCVVKIGELPQVIEMLATGNALENKRSRL